MCGLVGVAGKIGYNEKKAFGLLLILDQLRGQDSTGVFTVEDDYEKDVLLTNLYKELGAPNFLFDAHPDSFDGGGFYKSKSHLLMGHNRYATQGGITEETAHPFEFDNVVGAHNGTVDLWSLNTFHEHAKYGVDSQKIFSQLSHNPDIKEVWSKLSGAAALTWFDYRDNKLKIIRNDKRTLYYYLSTDKKTLFWASEDWMLNVALHRSRCADKDGKIYPFSTDELYEFEILNEFKNEHNVVHYRDIQIERTKVEPRPFPTWTRREDGGWTNYLPGQSRGVVPFGKKKEKETEGGDRLLTLFEVHRLAGGNRKAIFDLVEMGSRKPPYRSIVSIELDTEEKRKAFDSMYLDILQYNIVVDSSRLRFKVQFYDRKEKTTFKCFEIDMKDFRLDNDVEDGKTYTCYYCNINEFNKEDGELMDLNDEFFVCDDCCNIINKTETA